jgi:hypothetical protein
MKPFHLSINPISDENGGLSAEKVISAADKLESSSEKTFKSVYNCEKSEARSGISSEKSNLSKDNSQTSRGKSSALSPLAEGSQDFRAPGVFASQLNPGI